jgi:hypothetical protein
MQFSLKKNKNEAVSKKYLGVFVDSQLNWNRHGDYITSKVCRNIYLLRNMSNGLSAHCLRIAYYSLINCHLEYCILVWGHSSSRHRLFQLQRRSVRIIANIGYRDDCRQKFIDLKILTLPCLYIYRSVEYILNNFELYPKLNYYHRYNTRTVDASYKPLRLSKSRDAVNYYCIKFYNKLPNSIKKERVEVVLRVTGDCLLRGAFYSFEEFLSADLTLYM